MTEQTESKVPWWGTFELGEDHGGRWQIGPCTLWLHRSANEWRVLHRTTADSLASGSEVTVPAPDENLQEVLHAENGGWEVSRFSLRQTDPRIALRPALADRPVVVRPEHALYVPSEEEVTLYVSTPLWVQIELEASAKQLHELPAYRPSDTWFGPSTRVGELCYASRTAGRLRLAHLPLRMHRAVTPLLVRNRASDVLHLERVQIPTPYLALYQSANHYLWTQAVTLARAESEEGATVDIKRGAPREVSDAELVHEPRRMPRRGLMVSTFKALGSFFSH